jgi:hypothetical protein
MTTFTAFPLFGIHAVATANRLVIIRGMAGGTGKVLSFWGHVNIQRKGRGDQGTIQVAMLDFVAAAAVKVAGSARLAGGQADVLRDICEVRWIPNGPASSREFCRFRNRKPGAGREFFVSGSGVVANETIHIFLNGEIKIFVFPTVANVATGATRLVGLDIYAEVVNECLFAQCLAGGFIDIFPRPVRGMHNFIGGLGVAGEAGFGDILRGCKGSLQGW